MPSFFLDIAKPIYYVLRVSPLVYIQNCPLLLFILSKINLLIFPESLFAGLISRHFGLISKFSLWSLRVIKASRFFMHSIRLPMERLSAMRFSSLSISEMLSSDPRLYVFVMLSCRSLLLCCHVGAYNLCLEEKLSILKEKSKYLLARVCMSDTTRTRML